MEFQVLTILSRIKLRKLGVESASFPSGFVGAAEGLGPPATPRSYQPLLSALFKEMTEFINIPLSGACSPVIGEASIVWWKTHCCAYREVRGAEGHLVHSEWSGG